MSIVDGIANGTTSFFITDVISVNPWVRIDLLQLVLVERIIVLNRHAFYSEYQTIPFKQHTSRTISIIVVQCHSLKPRITCIGML